MAGNTIHLQLADQLFAFAKETMDQDRMYPYVSLVIKQHVVVSYGKNQERETCDVTQQDQVVAVRRAQTALDTGNLAGCMLFSFFEPTILGFDVTLWSGIRSFAWCISKEKVPHLYTKIAYSPSVYAAKRPGKITIIPSVREDEAQQLLSYAKRQGYYSGV